MSPLGIRVAVRHLVARPVFTVAAVLTLALGMGANTAIFSLVEATLIRPLPVRDIERVVAVSQDFPQHPHGRYSPREFRLWQADLGVFEQIGGSTGNGFTLTGRTEPEALQGQLATPGLLDVLGVRAELGRTFVPAEGVAGHDRVVLLTHEWWVRRFNGDRRILGTALTLNGEPYTVIGVLPAGFDYPGPQYQVWVPAALDGPLLGANPDAHFLRVVGKLKPGITPARLLEDLRPLGARLSERDVTRTVTAVPLREELLGDLRRPLTLLMCAGGIVLLIACANVANLLLAQATARHGEMAIRLAIGARRSDIVRQSLLESTLLSLSGAAGGLLLATTSLRLFKTLGPRDESWLERAHLDLTVFAFAGVVAVAAGVIFGVAPALLAARSDLGGILRGGSRSAPERNARRLPGIIVAGEMTLCVMLLITAGLLVRSLTQLERVNPGFQAAGVVVATFAMQPHQYPHAADELRFYRDALAQVKVLPGVQAIGMTGFLPLAGESWGNSFTIEGRPAPAGETYDAQMSGVSPDYFRAIGIPLLSGRVFTDADDERHPGVALINRAMATQYWPGEDPIGERIKVTDAWLTIVGVVGDVHHDQLDVAAGPGAYLSYPQMSASLLDLVGRGGFLVMRSSLGAGIAQAELRQAIHVADPEMPLSRLGTMESFVTESVSAPRFRTSVIGVFAVLAVVLATVGIYGVISYMVAQRVTEIGVRVALGASPAQIFGRVLGRTMLLVVPATAGGVLGAIMLSHLLAGLLFGVGTMDLFTYVAAPVVLVGVAMAAAYLPAWRAASLDPMVALRDG